LRIIRAESFYPLDRRRGKTRRAAESFSSAQRRIGNDAQAKRGRMPAEREVQLARQPDGKRLFDGRHEFLLEPMAGGKLKFIQRENFSGILVPLIWALIKKDTRRGFEEMNAALKSRAENN
jgi:hypothetical protein